MGSKYCRGYSIVDVNGETKKKKDESMDAAPAFAKAVVSSESARGRHIRIIQKIKGAKGVLTQKMLVTWRVKST